MRKVPAILILLAMCVPQLFAWGEDGHRTVCRIAYQSLSTGERKEIDRLVKAYHTPSDTRLKIHSFPDACVFPDEARANARTAVKEHSTDSPWLHFTPFNDWHFLNVERNVKEIPESACADDCVLTGIATHSAMLKNGATDQERAEGLIFLGHWVGDVHQPLHISFQSDEGGNKIAPVTGGFYSVPAKFPLNLHSVWDSGIIRKALTSKGWLTFADGLKKKITTADKKKWLASTSPLAWAQESYDITTEPDTQYCHQEADGCDSFGTGRTLTSAYQTEFLSVVDQRLEMAGTRLAALIRENLKK